MADKAVAQAVAPFGIVFAIAKPGPVKTNFGTVLVIPPPMDVYENTPAGVARRALASDTFRQGVPLGR